MTSTSPPGCSPSAPGNAAGPGWCRCTPAPWRHCATTPAEREQRCGPPGDGAAFFRTDRSDRISYNAANHTFTVLRRRLGWTAAGRTRAPRVHDLRHRMVVRRIQAWHADDVDVDCKIAVLATYLGHVEVRDALLVPVRRPGADEHRRRPLRRLRRHDPAAGAS